MTNPTLHVLPLIAFFAAVFTKSTMHYNSCAFFSWLEYLSLHAGVSLFVSLRDNIKTLMLSNSLC